jgi:hypothetical protein
MSVKARILRQQMYGLEMMKAQQVFTWVGLATN